MHSRRSEICLPVIYRALNGSETSCWCPYLTAQRAKFPKISLLLNLHNSSLVHHANAALCKSLGIQASCITKRLALLNLKFVIPGEERTVGLLVNAKVILLSEFASRVTPTRSLSEV